MDTVKDANISTKEQTHENCLQAAEEENSLPKQTLAAISYLSCAFRAGVPLRIALDATASRYGTIAWDTPGAQDHLINQTIYYKLPENVSDSSSFGVKRIARFLRLVMDEIDHLPSPDISENFTEIAVTTCQSSNLVEEQLVWIVLRLPKPTSMSLPYTRDLPISISPRFSDLGLRVWDAGLLMYSYIIGNTKVHQDVKNRSILELGAGTGICATAYADTNVSSALLTDISYQAVDNIRRNIKACQACAVDTSNLDVTQLDVANVDALKLIAHQRNIHTILASDVSYDDEVSIVMIKAFKTLIDQFDITGYLFVTRRSEYTDNLLSAELRKTKLFVEEFSDPVNTQVYNYLQDTNLVDSVRAFRISST